MLATNYGSCLVFIDHIIRLPGWLRQLRAVILTPNCVSLRRRFVG